MKVAVIGASGFVGLRLVEHLHLTGRAEVVPVVHAYRSLAVLARFGLPWRVTNPSDPEALGEALKGCDCVVHAALGDAGQIVTMAEALYPAAAKAGVKRIVALSSAAVHSLTPAPGTDETTAVLANQKSDYNAAKVKAELLLDAARSRGTVELVQLRPSIIHGPRSRLVADIAGQLLDGTAYLVEEGHGICNAVGVDNLIQAIWLALTKPEADKNTFLVNDRETVTWREFYAAIAGAVGTDLSGVHYVKAPVFRTSPSEKLARIAATKSVMATLPLVPARVKRLAKAAAAAWSPPGAPAGWSLPDAARPRIVEEMCQLQSCHWRYPTAKAEQLLGFSPPVPFLEGMHRTSAWLQFVGLTRRG
ncbi:MAG TPA: NAD(P)-dependent oxidoreductase [Opitutaceae bacterium]|nr:NAD(P)-dependent oxidoreductase [Opitutaceae bacterium]